MLARRLARVAALAAALTLVLPLTAAADPPPVSSFTWSSNMEPLGFSPRPNPSMGTFNSDLAFWGNRAYQGTYDGFQIIDISNPADPQKILDYNQCNGNQGDVIVWGNILVRSWNSPAGATATCDGQLLNLVALQFEGLNVFDISNPLDPDLVASIDLPCGSHTATGVPDPANGRLLVYNSGSSSACTGIEIVEVPFDDPGAATFLRTEPAGRQCHDTSVILGEAMLAACAGGNGFTVWSLGGSAGGSLTDPLQLYSRSVSGVSIAHSSSFSWDGETLIFGHEPGGGSQAQCQATSSTVNKTLFFYDARTGTEVGRWVLPRPQTSAENCTIHNFNVVPNLQRHILVSGNYQSGIAVVDFTDRTAPVEIAFADPAPLVPTQLGGDWSSYWYDGFIYESDITRGLITWRLNDSRVDGHKILGHSNPQTQEFTLGPEADLAITKSDSPDPVQENTGLTYTLQVTNGGPFDADGVSVSDSLDGSLVFGSATTSQGTCAHDGSALGGTVTCALGGIAGGGSATVTIDVTPTVPGTIENTATVSSGTTDPDPANNSDTERTTVTEDPGTPTKVTGGGKVPGAAGAPASFVFNAREEGTAKGALNVVDHGTGQHVKAVSIDEVRILTTGEVRIRGTCTVDGGDPLACEILALDVADSGAGADEFHITVGDVYAAGGVLLTGNVQLH